MSGTLYICPTPIGNLEDITLRTLRILQEVDLIAAEDTRRTGRLLHHHGLKNRMISCHEHNEEKRARTIVEHLKSGADVALVSDAGMPGISDPAYSVINAACAAGLPITVLPGPSAVITGLVASGLPTDRFVFEGFLSPSRSKRRRYLGRLAAEERTMVFFASPRRFSGILFDMCEFFGDDRRTAVARELSKRYEEVLRGTLKELHDHFVEEKPRGEITLIVEGCSEQNRDQSFDFGILEHLQMIMEEGIAKKKAIKIVAKERGLPKRKVYDVAVQIPAQKDEDG